MQHATLLLGFFHNENCANKFKVVAQMSDKKICFSSVSSHTQTFLIRVKQQKYPDNLSASI